MSCARLNQVLDAWMDGELDADTSAELERHVRVCATCSSLQAERAALTQTLRGVMPYHRAPPALKARVRHTLTKRALRRWDLRGPSWRQAGAVAACMALISALATYTAMKPPADDPLREQVVASHVASLSEARRLIAVESTERHVVKPWFQGKVDFAPTVKDLSDGGFVLLGGRVDLVGERKAAAIVYRIRSHFINVFVWRSDASADAFHEMRSRGFNVVSWAEDGLRYSVISDVDQRDLRRFATLLRAR